jgi:uncharacterized protein involved in outer membrane biogenesis
VSIGRARRGLSGLAIVAEAGALMRPLHRRLLASITLPLLGALLALATLCAFEFEIPLDGQRDLIAHAVSDALGLPVVISDAVTLHTGPQAGLEVRRLRIGSAEARGGWTLDAARLFVRVQTIALLRRDIRLAEVVLEDGAVCVRGSNVEPPAHANAQASGGPAWTLTEIARLQVRNLSLVFDPSCDPARRQAMLQTLDLRAPRGAPTSIVVRAVVAGEQASLDARGPSLAAFAERRADPSFELSARFAQTQARVAGRIDLARLAFDAVLALQSPQFVELLRPLGAPFKDFGPLDVQARVTGSRTGLKAQLLDVTSTPIRATGEVAFDASGARPAVTIALSTERLDVAALRGWLDRSLATASARPGAAPNPVLEALRASDGRFAIGVRQLVTGAVTVSDVAWDGNWRDGELRTRARAALQRSPIEVSADADLRQGAPVLSLTANAKRLVLPAGLGVGGMLGSVDLRYVRRAVNGTDGPRHSHAIVDLRSAVLALPLNHGESAPLDLARARIEWRQGEALAVEGAGRWLGHAVRARLDGQDIGALWQGRAWPWRARGAIADLHIASEGALSLRHGRVDADGRIELQADRLGPLVPGFAAWAELPLRAEAAVALQAGAWRIDLRRVALGHTDASGWAAGGWPIGAGALRVDARFGTLDLVQLTAGPAPAQPAAIALPRHLTLPAAEVALRASRVMLPGTVATDVRVDASTTDGRLAPSPFSFDLDGAKVRGTLSADLRGDSARIALAADASDIGDRHFGGALQARGVALQVDALRVDASSTGNQTRELIDHARADIAMQRAVLGVRPRGSAPAVSAELAVASLAAAPGEPTRLALDGTLQGLPAHVEASLPALAALAHPADAEFRISGAVDGIDLDVAGPWPGSPADDRPWRVAIAAPTLSRFDRMLGVDLPAVGPVRVEVGVMGLAGERATGSVHVNLGQSRLDAQLAQSRAGDLPRWDLDLSSPHLRLEDLGATAWLQDAEQPGGVAARTDASPARAREAARALVQRIRSEARRLLQRFDAHARVAVDRITAGADDFGRLQADATLAAGRLQIAPLSLAGPRGDLRFAGRADLSVDTTPFALDVDLSRFAYGRLLRNIDPKRSAEGELSFRLKLEGEGGGDAKAFARSLDGKVGLLVLPASVGSAGGVRLLDRWGTGLLANLDSTESRLNCSVAAFDVAQGVARSTALMVDTTRVRAAGELEVDLSTTALKGSFASKAKRPELFTPKVPVVLGGTLRAPTFAPATGSVLMTTARYVFFAYAYLFDTVEGKADAPDGTPDCMAAYRRFAQ